MPSKLPDETEVKSIIDFRRGGEHLENSDLWERRRWQSTFAANLVREFAERGFNVYAVDADPDVSLGATLGLDPADLERLKPVIDMKAVVDERSGGGGGALYNLNPKVDDLIDDFTLQQGNIKFLRMEPLNREELPAIAKRILLYAVPAACC